MLREFDDSDGVHWRVWDVNPAIHARSKTPRHAFNVPDGWLCFESADERRRLTPVPAGWLEGDYAALEELLGQAEIVPRREPDQGMERQLGT
jgi:hypothetical protein